jgi:hypothetical protein
MTVPRGAAPKALLGVLALFIALALAVVPVVDARPKDKKGGNQDEVATETAPAEDPAHTDPVVVEPAPATEPIPVVEQPLTANEGNASNDRSLIQLDADGDYIPDALDNCPNVQNPEQADGDGDGNGDACPVLLDTDGDTVADQQDNCPTVATSDYSDNDGDGVGNPCDKSPDGVEPEPEPLPDIDGQGGEGAAEELSPENGEGLNGEEVERDGRSRSRQRSRTDISRPEITTGTDGGDEGAGGPAVQEEPLAEEPVRDNPRRNEELIAEAAASGELYAPPEPPPVPQRAWDEEAAGAIEWESIIRIDAGATDDATQGNQNADNEEPNDAGRAARGGEGRQPLTAGDEEVGDSGFARGWVRAKLLLQDELDGDAGDDVPDSDGGISGAAPVPVENGLVIEGSRADDAERDQDRDAQSDGADEPLDESEPSGDAEPLDEPQTSARGQQEEADRGERRDGSRRDGSSRSAAAPTDRQRSAAPSAENGDKHQQDRERKRGDRRRRANGGVPAGWSDDRYYSGGSALNWTGDIGVAGTDDDGLYLTQRSGSGPGKRRGFEYAIPVDGEGVYLVRLYFAEPYWGASGGPEGEEGRRVFSVTGEGEELIEDFDVFAEGGALTALVKQGEIEVTDGELNLRFIASEGEPIVAAIELLQPSR